MATEVILMQKVENLGMDGDVVRVAEGYARNYLFPKNLAAPVTAATRRRLEKLRADRTATETARVQAFKDLADRVAGSSVTISVRTGAADKMFGAVTAAHIADALKLQGFEIDRHQIELAEPIKELGVFTVPVRLQPETTAALKVWIVEE
ncbi:MAG: 50S ribosomal protein L9 [Verrucomicrobia bacterium A1]|jgi:large subunit ribosomal protein L9|nr:MAG: 50S ribosomal protein L9 [Verrucomicrobia bacterium A1]